MLVAPDEARRVASNIAKLPGLLKVKLDAIALASAVEFAASPFEENGRSKYEGQPTNKSSLLEARAWLVEHDHPRHHH